MKTLGLLPLASCLLFCTQAHATIIGLSEHVDLRASFIMDEENFSNSYSGAVYQVDPEVTTEIYPLEESPGPDEEDRFMGFSTDPTTDGIRGEYYSQIRAKHRSIVDNQQVWSIFQFRAISGRYYDGYTPEGLYFYQNYVLDSKIDYTFTFRVDGEETRLQIYDALWDPLHPGLATYSIRDHTSRVTQHYNMETAPYMQSFTLEDGHVYTFNLDMTHFGRACHPKESFHIYFYDHIIMPEPSISTLWMLGLSVLGMVRRRKDLFIARNRRI